MNTQTKRLFQRVGEAPRQKRGHIPNITIRGSTVKALCSCGFRLGGTGCNRSGMDYFFSWVKSAYEKHIEEAVDGR